MDYIKGVTELADLLKVSRPTIYDYIKKGMPCIKSPIGKYLFVLEDVQKWIRGE